MQQYIKIDASGYLFDGLRRLRAAKIAGVLIYAETVEDGPTSFLNSLIQRELTILQRAEVIEWRRISNVAKFAAMPGRVDKLLVKEVKEVLGWQGPYSERQITKYRALAKATPEEKLLIAASATNVHRAYSELFRVRQDAKTLKAPIDDRHSSSLDKTILRLCSRILSILADPSAIGFSGVEQLQAVQLRIVQRFPAPAITTRPRKRELLIPRPYQCQILDRVTNFVTDGIRRILIASPTGSGKTLIALLVLQILLKNFSQALTSIERPLRIVWIALRQELLDQAIEMNHRYQLIDPTLIVFTTPFRNELPQATIGVLDEGHHEAAPSLVDQIVTLNLNFVLGLSATPRRADRKPLLFEHFINDTSISSLLKDEFLSPFDHYTIAIFDVDSVVACFLREREKWGQTIIFFRTREECHRAASLLESASIRAGVVLSGLSHSVELNQFCHGELDVLLNAGVLMEGYDYPALQTVFVRDCGESLCIQMSGRALRTTEGKSIANIIQSASSKSSFATIAPARHRYVWMDTAWKSVTIEPLSTDVLNNLHIIASNQTSTDNERE